MNSVMPAYLLILSNLEHDMKNFLYWFKINSLKSDPGKFQFMALGQKNWFISILMVVSINMKESDEVELVGMTIGKYLNFRKHIIENVCRIA